MKAENEPGGKVERNAKQKKQKPGEGRMSVQSRSDDGAGEGCLIVDSPMTS